MAGERPYIAENAATRAQLGALAGRLTDDELATPLGDGWMVSAALAHLAFWDRRLAAIIARWERDGAASASPVDADAINEALTPIWFAVPPREAARLVLEAADLADDRLERLSAQLVEAALAGDVINPFRARHRLDHIEQIELALAG